MKMPSSTFAKDRLKFFGGAGKMLLPGPATVAALISEGPGTQTHHDESFCARNLPSDSTSRGLCPLRPKKPSRQLAHDPSNEVAIGGS